LLGLFRLAAFWLTAFCFYGRISLLLAFTLFLARTMARIITMAFATKKLFEPIGHNVSNINNKDTYILAF